METFPTPSIPYCTYIHLDYTAFGWLFQVNRRSFTMAYHIVGSVLMWWLIHSEIAPRHRKRIEGYVVRWLVPCNEHMLAFMSIFTNSELYEARLGVYMSLRSAMVLYGSCLSLDKSRCYFGVTVRHSGMYSLYDGFEVSNFMLLHFTFYPVPPLHIVIYVFRLAVVL